MSSFLNKAKDKIQATLDSNSNKSDNPRSSNEGPHSSNLMNQADPRIDSDRDHRNDPTSRVGGYGNTQTDDQYGMAQGPAGVTSSDTYGTTTNDPGYDNPRSGNLGPHSSNLMNKADPKVDSDADGRNDPSSRVGGYGTTQRYGDDYDQARGPGGVGATDTGYGGTTNVGSTGYSSTDTGYDNPSSTNDGPHRSNFANKLDPRVDSDRDGRNDPSSMPGGYGNTQSGYTTQNRQADTVGYGADTGYTGTTSSYDNPQSGSTGPHNSNLMNKLDPRAKSDNAERDYPSGGNYSSGGDNSSGGMQSTDYSSSGGAQGGYTSSGVGETGGYGDTSYTAGSGNAAKTAGPHNSNIANKLDPRVDSDMDGSKTYGGNATYQ